MLACCAQAVRVEGILVDEGEGYCDFDRDRLICLDL